MTADAEQFDPFAELGKWRHWAARLLGVDGFQSDDGLRSQIGDRLTAASCPTPPDAPAEKPPAGDLEQLQHLLSRGAFEVAPLAPAGEVAAPHLVADDLPPFDAALPREAGATGEPRIEVARLEGVNARVLVSHASGPADPSTLVEVARLHRQAWERGGMPATVPLSSACSRCGTPLLFSARARGDGLCGPCHRKATGTQSVADRCREAGIEPSLVQELVLEILHSPEGRAAIGKCMHRPPVRMRDGTWREPTPGSEARPGDWVRRSDGSSDGIRQEVHRVDGETLWLCAERGGYTSVRTCDVEVVVPAEHLVPVRTQSQEDRRRRAGKDGAP